LRALAQFGRFDPEVIDDRFATLARQVVPPSALMLFAKFSQDAYSNYYEVNPQDVAAIGCAGILCSLSVFT